jgi:hypothetical protein
MLENILPGHFDLDEFFSCENEGQFDQSFSFISPSLIPFF